ncbi:Aldo keto reductase [Mycena metata]|uniref:Aldo keto reductase n=1 Tax=Mycena metata TaxID=1033252 RepID=A0AAD7ILU2_9AGAR|nr:Aldo keto reductase [Mycena metata]
MSTATTKMEYVRLGQSGLRISKVILGCMSYGNPNYMGNWVLPEEEGSKYIKAAYDAGINAFDTANGYSNGLSEEVLGRVIKEHKLPRDEIVILTKLFFPISRNSDEFLYAPPELWTLLVTPTTVQHIFDSVKHSLRRLQLDYIDVTVSEETMQALHDVVKAGHVRYIGMSSCYAWQFHAMQNYAINNKLTPFIIMENHYNLLYREEEREMFPTLKHFNVGAIPCRSPLARGALTRPLESQSTSRGNSDSMPAQLYVQSTANQTIVKRSVFCALELNARYWLFRVEEIAKKRDISMAQVSLAWLLSKEGVSAPIIGSNSLKNLADLIAAIHIKLTEEEIKYLEEPYQPMGILGH